VVLRCGGVRGRRRFESPEPVKVLTLTPPPTERTGPSPPVDRCHDERPPVVVNVVPVVVSFVIRRMGT
jgi:hypothetical protein